MDTRTAVSLYLRADGTLLLVKADSAVEIAMTPRQMLDLGVDLLRLALHHDPSLADALAALTTAQNQAADLLEAVCPMQ